MIEDINNTIRTYDKGAKGYHKRRLQSWIGAGNLDEHILKAKNILDYGCGPGILIPELQRLGFTGNYLGYDPSVGMIEEAQKSYQLSVTSFQLSFTSEEKDVFSSEKYDTVFMIAVLHHLTFHEIAELFRNLTTVTTAKAQVILTLWEVSKSERHDKFKGDKDNEYLVPLRDETNQVIGDRVYYEHDKITLVNLISSLGDFSLVEDGELKQGNFRNTLLVFEKNL